MLAPRSVASVIAVSMAVGAAANQANAGTLAMLHHFHGGGDGVHPVSDLRQVGTLIYGTTQAGGSHWSGAGVDATGGTIFRYNAATKQLAIVHSFGGTGDGAVPGPEAMIRLGSKLYGTTQLGGQTHFGTIFSYDINTHLEKVEYSFGTMPDGQTPLGGLVNVGGILYGTTSAGGSTGVGGTIYKFDPATHHESVVFSFKPTLGAMVPKSGIIDANGAFYGTTYSGGVGGTVYSYTLATKKFLVLHSFAGGTDGQFPQAKPLLLNGRLYGTTQIGGKNSMGTLWRLVLSTKLTTVLHPFGPIPDGMTPSASLVNVSGKLYGTTSQGGLNGGGTVFSFNTATSSYAKAADFTPNTGVLPLSALTPYAGRLYGLADGAGGTPSYGTLYSFTP